MVAKLFLFVFLLILVTIVSYVDIVSACFDCPPDTFFIVHPLSGCAASFTSKGLGVIIGVPVGLVALCILGCVICCVCQRSKQQSTYILANPVNAPSNNTHGGGGYDGGPYNASHSTHPAQQGYATFN